MYKKHFIEFIATPLQNEGDVVKFEVKAPKHCKKIIGVKITSPLYSAYNLPATSYDIMLSLTINNKKMFIGNCLFALGYLNVDLPRKNDMPLDEPLSAGELVEGYVECMVTNIYPFHVWITFTYLTEIDS